MNDKNGNNEMDTVRAVLVQVKRGEATESVMRFSETFLIGRDKDCQLQVKDSCVSRNHVKVAFEEGRWLIRDLESANGTFLGGERIKEVPLEKEAEIELGEGGPVIWLAVEGAKIEEDAEETVQGMTKEDPTESHIIRRYFSKEGSEEAGERTMMFRRAFERAHRTRSKKYLVALGVGLFLLLVAGGVIIYQKSKLNKLRQTAVDMFYTMKSIELQIVQLEEIILLEADLDQVRKLIEKREQLREMAKSYDSFVDELGIYAKLSVEEQVIFRLARLFGECDVKVPKEFVAEVNKYINKWKTTGRLKDAIERARSNGYVERVAGVMAEHDLPPHFFFLALQESGFNERAVGPKTRYGYAKGIWQFIPLTARHYGLKIGPLYKKRVYDPHDERYHFEKATKAAARYLKDINNTEAQASGLLVMASYNWGENNTRRIIRKMPENPRERNFWKLLKEAKIPRETYDYVFYIFSAAVICENPRLFGFDFDPPDLTQSG
jgi:pSer/pThr/pTyr-binding forkhead associated (FHA) protein/soluble lytic murein transglycosylase-like protein